MVEQKSVADVLEEAAGLIEPEGAWTQKHIRLNAEGRYTANGSEAVCWCVVGATMAVTGIVASMAADRYFAEFLGETGVDAVERWNDAPERTQAEVVAKLREAAAKARAESAHD